MSISICGRSGLWPFRFVAVPVCGRFGLWPFRFVAVSVCGRFGLWPFRFVAVSVLAVSVCGRYDQNPSRWPFTGEFFQTLRHHLSICICYLGAESNIVLFSLTRNDVSGLQTAPGGGGKAGITQFSGMTITSYFILVADIFRLEENDNIWQTTFSNGFSLVKWLPCGFKEDLFPSVQLTSQQ